MNRKWNPMKTSLTRLSLLLLLLLGSVTSHGQTGKTIKSDIYTVVYSEDYQQPLKLTYIVQCPSGGVSRGGLDFYTNDSVNTSDNNDYKNNEWDRGHLAPAAAFNCDRETLKKTFSYLNCALQHEGLNRGPWKELERFERNLAKFFEVMVSVEVDFGETPYRVPAGAAIPIGFTKTISFDNKIYQFYFPNTDVAGQDWFNFIIAQ
jgi:DNA/RNA endonuclease G (NUC1)